MCSCSLGVFVEKEKLTQRISTVERTLQESHSGSLGRTCSTTIAALQALNPVPKTGGSCAPAAVERAREARSRAGVGQFSPCSGSLRVRIASTLSQIDDRQSICMNTRIILRQLEDPNMETNRSIRSRVRRRQLLPGLRESSSSCRRWPGWPWCRAWCSGSRNA